MSGGNKRTGDQAEASKPLVSGHVKTASAAEGVVVARPTIEGDTVFFSPGEWWTLPGLIQEHLVFVIDPYSHVRRYPSHLLIIKV